MSLKDNYTVEPIKPSETYDWLLNKHYMKRLTCISYAFGLFENKILKGVCTYGSALPMGLRKGICGTKYQYLVYELNRLCINEDLDKNGQLEYIIEHIKKYE